jgi:excisionase family DNA binding protein
MTSGELAALSGISKRSIVKAVAEGRIKAARTVGGHYRISLTEARRFMEKRGLDTSELDARENCALVIAEGRFIGDLLADVLGQAGIEILQSEGLFMAGTMVSKYHPWLIILDATSAQPDPAAVCRNIVSCDACRRTSLLVLATGDEHDRRHFLAAGAAEVLSKPFSVKQLKSKLVDLGLSTGNYRRSEL